MVIITFQAEQILKKLMLDYVDTKTPQEKGRSAFWLWYDQIEQYIQTIENQHISYGNNLEMPMKYWGNIIYSCENLPNVGIIVVIEDFEFDKYNFTNWLNHAPLNEVPFTKKLNNPETWVNKERPIYPVLNKGLPICQSLGAKGIYKTKTSNGKWYVCDKHLNPIGNKYLYDEIKRFKRRKDGTYAIGIVQNQSWKIGTNGLIKQPNTNISIDSKGNYISANGDGADYVSENNHLKFDTIITETINNYLRNNLLAT